MKESPPENANRKIEYAGAAVFAAFALIVIATVVLTMPLFDPVYLLGPGLYPFSLAVLVVIACALLLFEIHLGKHDSGELRALFDNVAWRRPLSLIGLLAATLALLPVLGFLICLFLFSFVEMTWLEAEKRKWWINAIYAAAVTGGVYWLFEALTMTLPKPFWL